MINIKRFSKGVQEGGVLPESMTPPFKHKYVYAGKNGVIKGFTAGENIVYIAVGGDGGYVVTENENFRFLNGDTIAIPKGMWHTIICVGDELVLAAICWEHGSAFEGVRFQRFVKDKAHKAHLDTILADDVLPKGVDAPFGHAYGFIEGSGEMELHSHPTEEVYIVYEGEGIVTVGDEKAVVKAGDVIEIPRNVTHTMTAAGEGAFLWAAFWWN